MKEFKLNLSVTILLGAIIIGGFIFSGQLIKQKSIEKQQRIELASKKDQEQKSYISKQKSSCLDIYQAEGKKWNNVVEWNYDEESDKCEITYNDNNRKPKAQCEKEWGQIKEIYDDKTPPPYAIDNYINCIDGTFTKEF